MNRCDITYLIAVSFASIQDLFNCHAATRFKMAVKMFPVECLRCVIVLLFVTASVMSVTVHKGVGNFSDEDKNTTHVDAYGLDMNAIDTTTLEHFTQLDVMILNANNFTNFPDLTPVGDTLFILSIQYNPNLHIAKNHLLAGLHGLQLMHIGGTKLKLLTSTCPEERKFVLSVGDAPLDICDCQMIWFKVSIKNKYF